ncbi:signal peptidase II [Nonomuraea sp. NPDC050328]|uniref:signal peptidase II n=1 Tax=Nonomuraea sp. NPDC050328 TaxID=3364361 RepID=UPI0037AF3452
MRDLQAAGGTPLEGGAQEPATQGEAAGSAPESAGTPVTPVKPDASAPQAPARDRRKLLILLSSLAFVLYAADLITKTIVLRTLEGEPPYVVIPGVLQFRVIFNSGAAFSIGTGMTFVFTIIAACVVFAIIRTARKLRSLPWAICLGMLLGGALGNLTDRLFRAPGGLQGHVVDFIEVLPDNFPIIGNFPIWNIADASIVCGGILAVVLAWRGYQIDGGREAK